jgi:radical SAM enzyme (TIGR01210 family)
VRRASQASTSYPAGPSARDRFVLSRRTARPAHDPWHAHGLVVDDEPDADGEVVRVAALFVTGRECPWRCVMCDLWRGTVTDDTPAGAVAAQVRSARAALAPDVRRLKIYNAGSFFDPRAVPEVDYAPIAAELAGLDRVTVESHPSLVGSRTARFLSALQQPAPALDVAMGLETAHPRALDQLNKRMTVGTFVEAARRLGRLGIGLRTFLLISPPFIPPAEQDRWLRQSIDTAVAAGSTVISLIPMRTGNGAIDALAHLGEFTAPTLADIERSLALALRVSRPAGVRILADLWDLDRCAACSHCLEPRRTRLTLMNLRQSLQPPVACATCGGSQA